MIVKSSEIVKLTKQETTNYQRRIDTDGTVSYKIWKKLKRQFTTSLRDEPNHADHCPRIIRSSLFREATRNKVYLKYTPGAGNEREFPFWKRFAWRLSRL